MAIDEELSKIDFWIQSIRHKAPNSPIVLVGTHADEISKQTVNHVLTTLQFKYQTIYSNVVTAVSVSCVKGGFGIEKLWQAIETAIQDQVY